MTMSTPVVAAGLAPDDVQRLRAAAGFVREQETSVLLSRVLPGLVGAELRAVAERCRFAHSALVVFPVHESALRAGLAGCGLADGAGSRPSVVVRDRLATRHGLDPDGLDVRILRPMVNGPRGERRAVEVFALTVPPGSELSAVAAHERDHGHEAHLAFEVDGPDPLVLRGLRAVFARYGAVADGGGYNPHEGGTVFYFAASPGAGSGLRRLELYAGGDHREALAEHLAECRPSSGPGPGSDGSPGAAPAPDDVRAEELLRLLTGAWTTRALAVCVELRLPEAMSPEVPLGAERLARLVGARPGALGTLLRYLAMLGVVARDGDGFRLTGTGMLLREEAAGSMRSLAVMYGGPFYESFAQLGHAVRTGEPGFERLHGENHFERFARDPELAAVFDRSMAAGSRMFGPLPSHPVLTAAARGAGTVVDVAGGTGELLGRVLAAHPSLRGVLLERPRVVEAARERLAATGVGGRCAFVAGEFGDVPGAGDVYLLSRVLHDWDDERCRRILAGVAEAMPSHAELLVVERVLPGDGAPSLATAWDLHMLCNTGGRERRLDEYAGLFEAVGLGLVGCRPLPLGAHVLHVRRR
ncbi:methyltransferase [Streptomyces sp. JNUCC 64]